MVRPKARSSTRLVLIDGHAILHRAYHAFPKTLTTRSGELVNAVYGFTRILLSVLKDLQPEYCAVAFDLPVPTFRHKEYVGYQVQRPAMDRELEDQIKRVKQIVEALGIPIFAVPGYEADDVIGTLARQATATSRHPLGDLEEVVIITGDRDLMQLVNKNTEIYFPQRAGGEAEIFDAKRVKEYLGVGPKQIVDYKGLVGDASDNYPGVPGIGPKTAVELINKYGSLEEIYKTIKSVRAGSRFARQFSNIAIKKKLKEGKESAFLSKKLATIVTNAPVKLDLKTCRVADYDQGRAIALFKELEFRSLIDKLPGMEKNKPEQPEEDKKEKEKQMELFK